MGKVVFFELLYGVTVVILTALLLFDTGSSTESRQLSVVILCVITSTFVLLQSLSAVVKELSGDRQQSKTTRGAKK
jgi:hypothetical protein